MRSTLGIRCKDCTAYTSDIKRLIHARKQTVHALKASNHASVSLEAGLQTLETTALLSAAIVQALLMARAVSRPRNAPQEHESAHTHAARTGSLAWVPVSLRPACEHVVQQSWEPLLQETALQHAQIGALLTAVISSSILRRLQRGR